MPPSAQKIEQTILALLANRREDATICPSEVARLLGSDTGEWLELMPAVREAAHRLAKSGQLVVTRRGVPVSALSSGGPIRLGRGPELTDGSGGAGSPSD